MTRLSVASTQQELLQPIISALSKAGPDVAKTGVTSAMGQATAAKSPKLGVDLPLLTVRCLEATSGGQGEFKTSNMPLNIKARVVKTNKDDGRG